MSLSKVCDLGNTNKNNIFSRKLADVRPTTELKAFFAFDESLPTSATLSARDTIKIWRAQLTEILCHDFGPHNGHQNHHCDEDFVWQFMKAAFISNKTNIGKDWSARKNAKVDFHQYDVMGLSNNLGSKSRC